MSKIILKCDFSSFCGDFYLFLMRNHIIMSLKELGEAYRNRRKDLRITQPHLAEIAQVSTNTLYKLERGQGNPSLDVLTKLADVLGMELRLEVKRINT